MRPNRHAAAQHPVSARPRSIGSAETAGRDGAGAADKRGRMPRARASAMLRRYWNSVASWPAAGRSELEMTSPFTVTVGVAMPWAPGWIGVCSVSVVTNPA